MGLLDIFNSKSPIQGENLSDLLQGIIFPNYGGIFHYGNLEYYKYNPVLRMLIHKRAQALSQARFVSDNKNSELINRLNAPNPYQTLQDFLYQLEVFTCVYGDAFILPYAGEDFIKDPKRSELWVLDGGNVHTRRSYKIGILTEEKDIEYWYSDWSGQTIKFKRSESIPFYDTTNGIYELHRGHSRIDSVKDILSNIQKALEGKNYILDSPGGIGVLSNNNEYAGTSTPMRPVERADLNKAIDNYGLSKGKDKFIITTSNIKFTPFNINIDNFKFDEGIMNDILYLCNSFDVPPVILGIKNQTYENQNQSIVMFYQDLKPRIDNIASALSEFYGEEITASFEHIPQIQEMESKSKRDSIDALYKFSQAMNQFNSAGILLNENEIKKQMENLGLWS